MQSEQEQNCFEFLTKTTQGELCVYIVLFIQFALVNNQGKGA